MLRKLAIELDKVVIGSGLNAAKFAYENKASFIRNRDPSIFVKNIRLDEDCLTVATKNERAVKVKFNKCWVFDLANTLNFPLEDCEVIEQFRVFDWFYVNGIRNTEKDVIDTGDDFVSKIYLYKDRKKGGLVVESLVEKERRDDFEVSPTMARMKAHHHLKQEGLNFPTRSMKIEFLKRDYLPVKNTIYKEVGNIIYKGSTL